MAEKEIMNSSCDSVTLELSQPPIINVNKIQDGDLKDKVDLLIECFKGRYHSNPKYVIKVPGRVNLIGEHVDYCGFPVCPMAIDKSVFIAVNVGSDDKFLHVTNVNNNKYPDGSYKMYSEKLDISLARLGWISYILCGVQGVIDKNAELKKFNQPKSMVMAVSGDIPPSAGLSSSSALVCAAFMATCVMNDIWLSKTDIATLCAQCEQYIGTAGGGMDQAIAMHGQKGRAKFVKFNPLRLYDVILPDRSVVIIANSLAEKNKAMSNDFNTRVVECRLASQVLAKKVSCHKWQNLKLLADTKKSLDNLSFVEILKIVDKIFKEEPYTKQEVCDLLEVTPDELNKLSLTPNTYNINSFKLKNRATHVLQEGERVFLWRNWCEKGTKLDKLGTLMYKSHFSLQYLYECSHPDLDKLVLIFAMSGAYGARLTGAGWGGCVVALTDPDKVPDTLSNLYQYFYKNLIYKDEMDNAVFVVTAGDGAEIIECF